MAIITRWAPLQELDSMERRMRRFFDEVGFAPGYLPPADVYETDEEFVVELEVPGFKEPQLSIEQFDHTLTIKGEREETVATLAPTPRKGRREHGLVT